ncbi:MAG: Aminopeptidase [Myxococcaceae bacterium]|nr:Aminopeptidase [Myxococcaceae bacterium]
MARLDPHSYNDDTQPQTDALDWQARVDFGAKRLEAEATLHFRAPAPKGPLDLDTRDLELGGVFDLTGGPLPFVLHPPDPVLGARLEIALPAGARGVRIRYRTAPQASALQWLDPGQTAGGKEPFLFSQCQAIHARSVIPLQDTPRLRIRYQAQLKVPARLKAVMAAAWLKREVAGDEATEHFQMPQPIPPYLFAFAVGELVSRELGPRSRVYAEPSLVEAAAHEFAQVDQMIAAAEQLFGPYDWDRFDILTMPPSFPYGGMENPRLTFLTPTIITGDRSLVNVVAHELAHSWTGNLVSNANAEHFWLNEGFTVFAERRILEVLEGKEVAALHAALGRRSLDEAVARFSQQPELTRLRTTLAGIDPDEAYSQVPYEKGYLLLATLEEAVGREAFARFLRAYLGAFRFQSITTDDFLGLCERELPGALARVDAAAWIDGPGVPANAPVARSARLEQIDQLGGAIATPAQAAGWNVAQWQLYLDSVTRPVSLEAAAELDARFHLTASNNPEVLVDWLALAASAGYAPAVPRIEEVLGKVGRMKYLRPLYEALAKQPATRARARAAFERFKAGYHPIARQVVEGVLSRAGA